MRYAMIVLMLALVSGDKCLAQKAKKKAVKRQVHQHSVSKGGNNVDGGSEIGAGNKKVYLAEWGELIDSTKPVYTISDPNPPGDISMNIETNYSAQKKTDKGISQITYKVTKTYAYANTAKTATYELDTAIIKYLLNGVDDAAALRPEIKDPVQQKTVIIMEEEDFREKYKAYLPQPLSEWNTSSQEPSTYIAEFGRDPKLKLRKTTYVTKETDNLDQHLKLRYQDVVTTIYDLDNNTVQTRETLENVEGVEVNMKGIDIPWTAGARPLRIHFPGGKDAPSPPTKPTSAATAGTATADNVINDQTSSFHLSSVNALRKKYHDMYWQYIRKPVLTISFNYTPSYAYRTNRIIEQQFTHATDEQARSTTEEGIYGQIAEIHLGGTWRRTHTVYAAFMYLQNGFSQTSATGGINWNTGINDPASPKNNLRIEQNGFGIGYNYTGYGSSRLVNGIFDGTLFYLQNHNNEEGTRWNQFGAKVSAGLSLRPNYSWDIHFMPTFLYDISSINKGSILRSNFFNVGITAGITFRFMPSK